MKYTISHYDKLYENGGFYDNSVSLDDLISLGDNDPRASLIAEIFPGTTYSRAPYNVLSRDDAFLESIDVLFAAIERDFKVCPPSLGMRLKDCLIYDRVIYLPDNDEYAALYPTYRENDRPYVRALDASPPTRHVHARARRRVFYLSSAGSFNYGHWLVDDLARLKLLSIDPRPTLIIVQSFPGMDVIRRETLEFLTKGQNVKFEFLPTHEALSYTELDYASPITFHPHVKNPAALAYLRDSTHRRLGRTRGAGEKIYVKRRRDRGRVLINEAEIEDLLNAYGFISIDPETMPFARQAAIFAEARIVVGIMAASMCNTVFTRSGAHTIYLAPDGWAEPFYWDLASVMSHHYTAIHGSREFIAEEPPFDNFHIDTDLLKTALKNIL